MRSMDKPIHDRRPARSAAQGRISPSSQVQVAKNAVLQAFDKATKGMPAGEIKALASDLAANFVIAADMAGVK